MLAPAPTLPVMAEKDAILRDPVSARLRSPCATGMAPMPARTTQARMKGNSSEKICRNFGFLRRKTELFDRNLHHL